MKLYEIKPKPHLSLKIFATLIDYGIYITFFYIYVCFIGTETEPGKWTVTGLPTLPLIIFWFIYFVGSEAFTQATLGHSIFKLKVVKISGEKINLKDAFKRRVCDMLDFAFFAVPAIICIRKTDKYQRIGDLYAGTLVVKQSDVTDTEFSISSS